MRSAYAKKMAWRFPLFVTYVFLLTEKWESQQLIFLRRLGNLWEIFRNWEINENDEKKNL